MVLKDPSRCHTQFSSGRQVSRVFQVIKTGRSLQSVTENVYRCRTVIKKPLTKRKEKERDSMMCRLVTVESGLRKRKMMHGCVKKRSNK